MCAFVAVALSHGQGTTVLGLAVGLSGHSFFWMLCRSWRPTQTHCHVNSLETCIDLWQMQGISGQIVYHSENSLQLCHVPWWLHHLYAIDFLWNRFYAFVRMCGQITWTLTHWSDFGHGLISHLSLSGKPQNGCEVLVMVLPGLPNTRTSLTRATALLRPSYILFKLCWNSSCAHLILQDSLSNCYLANMVLNVVNIEDSGFSFMAR